MRISEFIALFKILVGPNSCIEGALGPSSLSQIMTRPYEFIKQAEIGICLGRGRGPGDLKMIRLYPTNFCLFIVTDPYMITKFSD